MGSGGLTAGLGAAEYSSSNCNSQIVINCSEVRTAVIATGAAIAGVGAVLFFIGIHNREEGSRTGGNKVSPPVEAWLRVAKRR